MTASSQPPFRQLFHFHGGLHLQDRKEAATAQPVCKAPIPARLFLPLHQHIGEEAEPLVKVGDHVLKGQPIAAPRGFVSAPVHASSSGVVSAIGDYPVPHPSGLRATCIVIDTDGQDKAWDQALAACDYLHMNPSELRNRIRDAGIVGLGGAGFPSYIKMNPGPGKIIRLLVINAVECEPNISCDDMLMRERPEEIIGGLQIIRHALQAEACVIGIEDNKPQAYQALKGILDDMQDPEIHLVQIPTHYPSGGEKQLIKVLTGEEVPSQGLPLDIGMVCHNVGTVAAVYRAVCHHEPLISRIVTLTGSGIAHPCNLEVRLGTPVSTLIELCGGYTPQVDRLLMGGPMMGFTLPTDELPVIKTTNCILAASREEMPPPPPPLPCIRCGECTTVCPANLLPQQLYWHARARNFDKVQDYNLFDCIECGCCAHVCPSHIPLVQYYRFAKDEIWTQEQEKARADRARQRHEFRLERIEQEKQERAQRLKEKKKALKNKDAEDPKKAAIQAALARARAKKSQTGMEAKNMDNLTEAQQRQINEADARRRALQNNDGGDAN